MYVTVFPGAVTLILVPVAQGPSRVHASTSPGVNVAIGQPSTLVILAPDVVPDALNISISVTAMSVVPTFLK